MPHYLYQVGYTPESWAALVRNPESRRDTIARVIEGMGGTLDCFYFAFGEHDVVAIASFPDNTTAGAFSIAAVAGGNVRGLSTTVLLTSEEGKEIMVKAAHVQIPRPGTS